MAGQIALLVVAAILATHAGAALALFLMREPWNEGRPGVAANRVALVARLLDAAEPAGRAAILAGAARSVPALRIAPWDGRGAGDGNALREVSIVERLREAFGRPLSVTDLSGADAPPESAGQEPTGQGAATPEPAPHEREGDPPHGTGQGPEALLHLGLRTPGGAAFRASLPDAEIGPPKRGVVVFTFLFLATSLTLLTVWAARALTAPLAQLAGAAEAFGTRRQPPPLPHRGPQEVLALAGALDRMRGRVARLLADRTQMLAAISHDLRTPITRLRLRAEFIEDETVRARTLRDLDQMNALVEAALAYARDERAADGGPETARPLVDVVSLVRTVCDGFGDTGADVRLEPGADAPRHLRVRARPEDLERALTNLVDNAVKYGARARLALSTGRGLVTIAVADDGPGIPPAEQAAMLQPFVRGDRARGRDGRDGSGGFGLGLSIVTAIAEAHGGGLSLENRADGGLTARLALPAAAEPLPA